MNRSPHKGSAALQGRPDRALPAALLLHVCCAPCAGGILQDLLKAAVVVTLWFDNSNIHPRSEYARRLEEMRRFADRLGVPLLCADYQPSIWLAAMKGLEDCPERGERCDLCFRMRLENSAGLAARLGFSAFATTLGISRWKILEQVNAAGRAAAAGQPGVSFLPANWRKGGGAQRMVEVARQEDFYQQEYCGCRFSLRDGNAWRLAQGRPPIACDAEALSG
ncbi:epoxyqueuosine reductase QueH [Desulfuromonas sp. CSMB_57]|jgi:predicted adenine nucleotide alpha hydrolase (AANH) superfamily ATPase|uniref:epoxyqueuosine reductase QueH n=1 Tax=Desulfuromonas sp. CSMB_57 TaxID=2807629 RepID=UPI001CD4B25A|nr:epoxyqueuosine reductase QueH [Desulfuromonas sp. CSMB_57]